MARINKSRFALLGLLTMGPGSGYDLRQRYEQSVGHFWSESYGQIYPILRGLEAEGLVEGRRERQGRRPPRTVYTINARGRAALRAWLREPAQEGPPRIELLLKLFFARQVGAAGAKRQVAHFREEQRALLQRLDEVEHWLRTELAEAPDLPYWLLTIQYGRRHAEASLRWVAEALPLLDALPPASARPADGDPQPEDG